MESSKNIKKFVVTNGYLYFVEWDDTRAVIAIDNQPGILSVVKRFDSFDQAKKVADLLNWKVVAIIA